MARQAGTPCPPILLPALLPLILTVLLLAPMSLARPSSSGPLYGEIQQQQTSFADFFQSSKGGLIGPLFRNDMQTSKTNSTGCYYQFKHYDEGDRIITKEACLNCTCHNAMLMCYLKVCPFSKPIGKDCKVERKPNQCCPVITCPQGSSTSDTQISQVPVSLQVMQMSTTTTTLRPTTTTTTETGLVPYTERGCYVDNKYYPDGAQLPGDPENPCELCYCIRNRTSCVMKECILMVEGCRPMFTEGICCPTRYNCTYEDDTSLITTETSAVLQSNDTLVTTLPPTTLGPLPSACFHEGIYYDDGDHIPTEEPCENCYCMKGDLVCAIQECESPLVDVEEGCVPLKPPPGQCCAEAYDCPQPEIATVLPASAMTEDPLDIEETADPSIEATTLSLTTDTDELAVTDTPATTPVEPGLTTSTEKITSVEISTESDDYEPSSTMLPKEPSTDGVPPEEPSSTDAAIDEAKETVTTPEGTEAPATQPSTVTVEAGTTELPTDVVTPEEPLSTTASIDKDDETITETPTVTDETAEEESTTEETVDVVPPEEPSPTESTTDKEDVMTTDGTEDYGEALVTRPPTVINETTEAESGTEGPVDVVSPEEPSPTEPTTDEKDVMTTDGTEDYSKIPVTEQPAVTDETAEVGLTTDETVGAVPPEEPSPTESVTDKEDVMTTDGTEDYSKVPVTDLPTVIDEIAGAETTTKQPTDVSSPGVPSSTEPSTDEDKEAVTTPEGTEKPAITEETTTTVDDTTLPESTAPPTSDDLEVTSITSPSETIAEVTTTETETSPSAVTDRYPTKPIDKVTPDGEIATTTSEIATDVTVDEATTQPSLPDVSGQTVATEGPYVTPVDEVIDISTGETPSVPLTDASESTTVAPEELITVPEGLYETKSTSQDTVDVLTTTPMSTVSSPEDTTVIDLEDIETTTMETSPSSFAPSLKPGAMVTDASTEPTEVTETEVATKDPSDDLGVQPIESVIPTITESIIPGEGNCVSEGVTYSNGDTVPTTSPCQESCVCSNSVVRCHIKSCKPKPPNFLQCTPIVPSGDCCPTFECPEVDSMVQPSPNCIVEGIQYQEGEHIPSPDPCNECYCVDGEHQCSVQICPVPEGNCVPVENASDKCCPSKYDCAEAEVTTSIPLMEIGKNVTLSPSEGETEVYKTTTSPSDVDSPATDIYLESSTTTTGDETPDTFTTETTVPDTDVEGTMQPPTDIEVEPDTPMVDIGTEDKSTEGPVDSTTPSEIPTGLPEDSTAPEETTDTTKEPSQTPVYEISSTTESSVGPDVDEVSTTSSTVEGETSALPDDEDTSAGYETEYPETVTVFPATGVDVTVPAMVDISTTETPDKPDGTVSSTEPSLETETDATEHPTTQAPEEDTPHATEIEPEIELEISTESLVDSIQPSVTPTGAPEASITPEEDTDTTEEPSQTPSYETSSTTDSSVGTDGEDSSEVYGATDYPETSTEAPTTVANETEVSVVTEDDGTSPTSSTLDYTTVTTEPTYTTEMHEITFPGPTAPTGEDIYSSTETSHVPEGTVSPTEPSVVSETEATVDYTTVTAETTYTTEMHEITFPGPTAPAGGDIYSSTETPHVPEGTVLPTEPSVVTETDATVNYTTQAPLSVPEDKEPDSTVRPDVPEHGCLENGTLYNDGDYVPSFDVCYDCYCLENQIVCSKQECISPGEGCVPLLTPTGFCCPTKYECPDKIPESLTTDIVVPATGVQNTTSIATSTDEDSATTSSPVTDGEVITETPVTAEEEDTSKPPVDVVDIDKEGAIIGTETDKEETTTISTVGVDEETAVTYPGVEATTSPPEILFEDSSCRVNETVYASGDLVPPNSSCQIECYCNNGTIKCDYASCPVPASFLRCTSTTIDDECCPQYDCESPTEGSQKKCERDGFFYEEGDYIPGSDLCTDCYCIYGKVVCAAIECPAPKPNCFPKPRTATSCCPQYICTESPVPATNVSETTPVVTNATVTTETSVSTESTGTDEPQVTTDDYAVDVSTDGKETLAPEVSTEGHTTLTPEISTDLDSTSAPGVSTEGYFTPDQTESTEGIPEIGTDLSDVEKEVTTSLPETPEIDELFTTTAQPDEVSTPETDTDSPDVEKEVAASVSKKPETEELFTTTAQPDEVSTTDTEETPIDEVASTVGTMEPSAVTPAATTVKPIIDGVSNATDKPYPSVTTGKPDDEEEVSSTDEIPAPEVSTHGYTIQPPEESTDLYPTHAPGVSTDGYPTPDQTESTEGIYIPVSPETDTVGPDVEEDVTTSAPERPDTEELFTTTAKPEEVSIPENDTERPDVVEEITTSVPEGPETEEFFTTTAKPEEVSTTETEETPIDEVVSTVGAKEPPTVIPATATIKPIIDGVSNATDEPYPSVTTGKPDDEVEDSTDETPVPEVSTDRYTTQPPEISTDLYPAHTPTVIPATATIKPIIDGVSNATDKPYPSVTTGKPDDEVEDFTDETPAPEVSTDRYTTQPPEVSTDLYPAHTSTVIPATATIKPIIDGVSNATDKPYPSVTTGKPDDEVEDSTDESPAPEVSTDRYTTEAPEISTDLYPEHTPEVPTEGYPTPDQTQSTEGIPIPASPETDTEGPDVDKEVTTSTPDRPDTEELFTTVAPPEEVSAPENYTDTPDIEEDVTTSMPERPEIEELFTTTAKPEKVSVPETDTTSPDVETEVTSAPERPETEELTTTVQPDEVSTTDTEETPIDEVVSTIGTKEPPTVIPATATVKPIIDSISNATDKPYPSVTIGKPEDEEEDSSTDETSSTEVSTDGYTTQSPETSTDLHPTHAPGVSTERYPTPDQTESTEGILTSVSPETDTDKLDVEEKVTSTPQRPETEELFTTTAKPEKVSTGVTEVTYIDEVLSTVGTEKPSTVIPSTATVKPIIDGTLNATDKPYPYVTTGKPEDEKEPHEGDITLPGVTEETSETPSSPFPPFPDPFTTSRYSTTPSTATTTWTPSTTTEFVLGPGACLFDGDVYVSAQQIPRDNPCDFCFCFRGDIICLQQSCPPPIPGCYEEPIAGFCCPRYQCPVPISTFNITTTTTPIPTYPPVIQQEQVTMCEVANKWYYAGEVVEEASGPCLECRCGQTGMMECDPKQCEAQPMLRKILYPSGKFR